uniref:Vomeronasal type-1 receptor n=1 Tax=Ornithorhynchus anatinus TaxID=9258 RepID=F6ZMW5_ORNAN
PHKAPFQESQCGLLTLANLLILLTLGIPETMSVWGLGNFLDNVGCKLLMYLYRVARGLAICTTCLLSIFQAVTISPGIPGWARIKLKLHRAILPSCFLSWIFNLFVGAGAPMYVTGPRNGSSFRSALDLKYCTEVPVSAATTLINAIVLSLRDLFFVVLMCTASGYMVWVLQRHLCVPGRPPGVMPEVRAAKRVVALVTLYILLYGRQSIMFSVLLNRKENYPALVNSNVVFSLTFSALSPFLMIHSDRRMRTLRKR